jgi:hypothetical protein
MVSSSNWEESVVGLGDCQITIENGWNHLKKDEKVKRWHRGREL